MDLFFFGNYANAFKVDANQNSEANLEKNDLQVGMGIADNTASKVEFASMAHTNGLVSLTLGTKSVPATRVFKPSSTTDKLFDRNTTTIKATANFSNNGGYTPFVQTSGTTYLVIGKSSASVTFTGNSSEKYKWDATTTTFPSNSYNSITVVPSREYDNAGWGFDYTGAVQSFTATAGITYQLEVWGAQGGGYTATEDLGTAYGYLGGYSAGQITYLSNQILYVCVGQKGHTTSNQDGAKGGYNGGGDGGHSVEQSSIRYCGGGGGGGCTHIASSNHGELSNYDSQFLSDVIIVAGGGGGRGINGYNGNGFGGGKAGGSTATAGYTNVPSISLQGGASASYYKIGLGQNGASKNVGGFNNAEGNGGGGGGYYGGLAYQGDETGADCSGSGGSGFLSSKLTEVSTIGGNENFPAPKGSNETGHTENGYAIITQLSY